MPLIWDKQLKAFVDTAPPLLYDPAIEAYGDTEGYVHDNALEAWRKVWPARLYLYHEGGECAGITGGWDAYPYKLTGWGSELAPTLVKGVSDMSASMQSPYAGAVATCATIQIDRFGKLCAICSGSAQIHSGVTLCLAPVISESQREVAVYSVIDMGTTKTDEQIIADISQISGSQHVIFRMVANCNVTIKQVWLE